MLELLGYVARDRHPLEILGYELSTQGLRRFRRERPDVFPQVCRLIERSLDEARFFPRHPTEEILNEGIYLERLPEGGIALNRSVEVSISQTARVRIDFASPRAAILELLRLVSDPAYVTVPPA
jgi:hypothetical protein